MAKVKEKEQKATLGLPCWFCGELMHVTVCKNSKGYHYVCPHCRLRGFFYDQHFTALDKANKFRVLHPVA